MTLVQERATIRLNIIVHSVETIKCKMTQNINVLLCVKVNLDRK